MSKRPTKLPDEVCDTIRLKHYSMNTERPHVAWIKRHILFYHKRHPNDMGVITLL